jgi:hypothetical protein
MEHRAVDEPVDLGTGVMLEASERLDEAIALSALLSSLSEAVPDPQLERFRDVRDADRVPVLHRHRTQFALARAMPPQLPRREIHRGRQCGSSYYAALVAIRATPPVRGRV